MSGLPQGLELLLRNGAIVEGQTYGKPDLIAILRGARGDVAEADFMEIRGALSSGGRLGNVAVATIGARRGMRYGFGLGDVKLTPQAEKASAPRAPVERSIKMTTKPVGEPGKVTIHFGDNLPILRTLASGSINLVYIDPPFNTGKSQARTQIRTERDDAGDRTGFKGLRYRTTKVGTKAFADTFDEYLEFLAPRLEEAHRLLAPDGSLFLHLDYREVHYAKVLLDEIFGRDCFMNEIIWAYDYGGRSTSKWSAKHDNILWFVKDPANHCFDFEEMDRIPYMAPDLVGEEKAARGKTPTDTWWHTIVSPNGYEKTGYPTQKPLGVINRIVKVHSKPGDVLLDFFAGSGTLGESGATLGRDVVLIDSNPQALEVMARRLGPLQPSFVGWPQPEPEQAASASQPHALSATPPTAGVESQRDAPNARRVDPSVQTTLFSRVDT